MRWRMLQFVVVSRALGGILAIVAIPVCSVRARPGIKFEIGNRGRVGPQARVPTRGLLAEHVQDHRAKSAGSAAVRAALVVQQANPGLAHSLAGVDRLHLRFAGGHTRLIRHDQPVDVARRGVLGLLSAPGAARGVREYSPRRRRFL